MPGTAAATQLAGLQTHVLWGNVDNAEMERQLDLVKASGASMTRVDVGWASVQQGGPGRLESWYTDRLDALVAAADARGIKLLLTFMGTPCWASTAPDSLKQSCAGEWWNRDVMTYAPRDPAEYAAALSMVAARYKGKVTAWEIWNEPNHQDFWKAPDQAAAYAALVKAAYPAVKAADPAAMVIAGALSESDHAFAARLYQLGIKGYFDAFSVHPYSADYSPLDPRETVDPRYSFVRGVPAVRDVMVRNGDQRPIWLSEAGFSTATTRTDERWRNGVSEETQAEFVREQLRQVARWSYVQVSIWYHLKDLTSDRTDLFGNCGLRRWDGSAKPAWAAFQAGVAELERGAAPSPDTGPGPDVDPPAGNPETPVSDGPPPVTTPPTGTTPPTTGTPAAPPATAPAPTRKPTKKAKRRQPKHGTSTPTARKASTSKARKAKTKRATNASKRTPTARSKRTSQRKPRTAHRA